MGRNTYFIRGDTGLGIKVNGHKKGTAIMYEDYPHEKLLASARVSISVLQEIFPNIPLVYVPAQLRMGQSIQEYTHSLVGISSQE
jgi:hypothetical protein